MRELRVVLIGAVLIAVGGLWDVYNLMQGTWPFYWSWGVIALGALIVILGLFKLSAKLGFWALIMFILAVLMLASLLWWK